jgi:ABC-type lipoprotein release transport system permease subunit
VIPIDFVVDPLAFLVMLAALLGIVTLASIVPARRASRLRIAALLHYE